MPLPIQDHLIQGAIRDPKAHFLIDWLVNLNNYPLLRPAVQYLLGLAMVAGRVIGGNVTYFNGQVKADKGFLLYFPELFSLKTQVALLILEWTLGTFAIFYFLVAVLGNLNLGIRHILPVYLPLFVLVALFSVRRLRDLRRGPWARASIGVFAALMLWYGGSTVAAFPNYLSYFNEIIGGPTNADKYFSDSSVDWGQDLKRLKTYVTNHSEIKHIAVDYFGGGVPQYYFCQPKYDDNGRPVQSADGYDCSHSVFEQWHAENGVYTGQYIAVSETFLENDRYFAVVNNQVGYGYLRALNPVAKVGNSIYVYKLY
jgi:hypothetical protein